MFELFKSITVHSITICSSRDKELPQDSHNIDFIFRINLECVTTTVTNYTNVRRDSMNGSL